MGDRVTIVGVSRRDQRAPMEEFVARHDLDLIDHAADVGGTIWNINGVGGQPAWVFVDGETGRATTVFGGLGEDGLIAAIDEHLGAG